MMERTLLLVDDEENILRSLRRLFRRQGYQILTANGGKEGLQMLQEHDVGVIVSDQRMPEMTGSEFLHQVKELYPDTVRIILSGYTDLESVTESINVGAVYKFLTKPWDDDLLCRNVEEAFHIFELNAENQRLNDELRDANQSLEARVQEKTRALEFNVQALQISQDILEELPIAVFGISDNEIVVGNRMARELFPQSPLLLGMPLADVVPDEILTVYQQAAGNQGLFSGLWENQQQSYKVECQRNNSDGPHEGFILTLRALA